MNPTNNIQWDPVLIEDTDEDRIERAVEWLTTLAHNEFPQTHIGYLLVNRSACCLGVAHLLFPTELAQRAQSEVLGPGTANDVLWNPADLGLLRGSQDELAEMNDNGKKFPEIAKELLSDPRHYFDKPVAEGIEEHFFGGAA